MRQYDVRLIHVKSVPLAVVRRRTRPSELASVVPASCGVVWEFVRARQLKGGRHVAIYWDCDINLDVGVELDGDFTEEAGVVRSATPAGAVATVTHLGPYQQLGAAHEAIRQWAAVNKYEFAGPNWEIYGHWQSEWNSDPSRIRTDVFYQLAPAVTAVG